MRQVYKKQKHFFSEYSALAHLASVLLLPGTAPTDQVPRRRILFCPVLSHPTPQEVVSVTNTNLSIDPLFENEMIIDLFLSLCTG